MAFTELSSNLNIIQALDRYPNTNDGLTYAQLQAKFDEAAGLIKTYLNDTLLAELASTTNSSSGADNIGATAVSGLTGTTVQALIESIVTVLQSQTDGSSGGDFVKLTQIGGLSGTSLQEILESLKSFVDTGDSNLSGALAVHKSSDDHDGRYYTETELNAGQLNNLYYTETELNAGQLNNLYYTETELNAGQLNNLYFTETELSSTTDSSSGADKIGATPIGTSASTVQGVLEYLKNEMDGVVLGQIPDNSLTDAKLDEDIKIGSLASLTTTEKASVVGAINELDSDLGTLSSNVSTLTTNLNNGLLENSIELAKGLFTVQSQMAAGLNSLSQMAIDVFNDENGIASKTNEDYDNTNKLYKPDANPAKTVTANGDAKISTSQSKFGGASGYLDINGDYLSIANSTDFNFGSGDFTIDGWFRFDVNNVGYQFLIDRRHTADYTGWALIISNENKLWFAASTASTSSGTWNVEVSSNTIPTVNEWHHIAVVRNGSSWTMYFNGTSIATATKSITIGSPTQPLLIGYGNATPKYYYGGYIDELRISKGIARWTSNFTPPTEAYTTDSYTKLLLHMDGTNGSTTFTDSSSYVSAMTLISNALTCSSAPTKGFVCVDETLNSATITYYLSRDNGSTWTEVTKETLTDLSGQPSGTSLKIKAVTSGGIAATPPQLKAWAFGYK